MKLTARERKQAGNYLAIIHATGRKPSGMHIGSNWSLTVHLGYQFVVPEHGGAFYAVQPDSVPLIEGHPLLASVEALKRQGFAVDHGRIDRHKRWTRLWWTWTGQPVSLTGLKASGHINCWGTPAKQRGHKVYSYYESTTAGEWGRARACSGSLSELTANYAEPSHGCWVITDEAGRVVRASDSTTEEDFIDSRVGEEKK